MYIYMYILGLLGGGTQDNTGQGGGRGGGEGHKAHNSWSGGDWLMMIFVRH